MCLLYPSAYSDFLDKDMEEPGDEYLPLGPSFQEHVQLFVKLVQSLFSMACLVDGCPSLHTVYKLLCSYFGSFKIAMNITIKNYACYCYCKVFLSSSETWYLVN